MCLAKTDLAYVHLVKSFFQRAARKTYLALASGVPVLDAGSSHVGMVQLPVDGYPAQSEVEILETYLGGKASLVRVRPRQGRKHQVGKHPNPKLLEKHQVGNGLGFRNSPHLRFRV